MSLPDTNDGQFYASGRDVFRSPIKTKTPTGHSYKLGFKVCTLCDGAGDDAAEAIANALNKALERGEIA